MDRPARHRLDDPSALRASMAAHPLGTWVCQGRDGLIANHVPFWLDPHRGPLGTLIGHVARANPVWRELGPATPSVVTFQGPQAYVTPAWYPGKAAHGRVVPTWNDVVAHAHGMARAVEDRDWLRQMLDRLSDAQEAGRPAAWRVGDAPAACIERMMRAIVGIEIPIDRLAGKRQACQDEDLPDRLGTVQGLRAEAADAARAMADIVQQTIEAEGLAPPAGPAGPAAAGQSRLKRR